MGGGSLILYVFFLLIFLVYHHVSTQLCLPMCDYERMKQCIYIYLDMITSSMSVRMRFICVEGLWQTKNGKHDGAKGE